MKTDPATLLHLDVSPRGDRSKSRHVGAEFVARWRENHPAGQVLAHDLGRNPPPFVNEAWVEGAFAPADAQSASARLAIAISNQFVDELLAADQILITTPIYNLSVPAALKAWIDQIVRAGRTFSAGPEGYRGLVANKRITVIAASGGDFRPGAPAGAMNFLEPYLRAIFGFIGITDLHFVYAHSLASEEAGPAALRDAEHRALELAQAA
jgi:FMN-dependent NADH-azoreductase